MSTKKKKTFGSKLQPDASVTAVLLSIKFDEEGFKCSASQVHDAAALGDHDLVHVLLDAGVDINEPDGPTIRSPLHVASTHGLASTVAKLLDLGADPLLKDKHRRTPVDLAANEEVKTAFAEHCEQQAPASPVCVCVCVSCVCVCVCVCLLLQRERYDSSGVCVCACVCVCFFCVCNLCTHSLTHSRTMPHG